MRPTLPSARGSSQLAAIAESLVTDAERSNRRVTCLLHIISDGTRTRVRHAQGITLSILRASISCAATVQTAVLVLFGPSCLGHYRPLQLLHAHCLGLLLLRVCFQKLCIWTGKGIPCFGRIRFADLTLKPRLLAEHTHTQTVSFFFLACSN